MAAFGLVLGAAALGWFAPAHVDATTPNLVLIVLAMLTLIVATLILSIVVLVVITAASVKGLYPTQHDLDVAAAASIDNPAALAFNGPAYGLDSVGETHELGVIRLQDDSGRTMVRAQKIVADRLDRYDEAHPLESRGG